MYLVRPPASCDMAESRLDAAPVGSATKIVEMPRSWAVARRTYLPMLMGIRDVKVFEVMSMLTRWVRECGDCPSPSTVRSGGWAAAHPWLVFPFFPHFVPFFASLVFWFGVDIDVDAGLVWLVMMHCQFDRVPLGRQRSLGTWKLANTTFTSGLLLQFL